MHVAHSISLILTIAISGLAVCAQTEKPPNILVILVDDMGYGDPGCYNPDSKIPTPPTGRIAGNQSAGWSPIQGAFWLEGGIAPDLELKDVLPKFTEDACAIIQAQAAQSLPGSEAVAALSRLSGTPHAVAAQRGVHREKRRRDVWGSHHDGSPAHNITAAAPPTLVFLGSKDELISVAVLERFKKQMTQVGVRCETRVYEGQPHGFFNREPHKTKTLVETDRFLTSLGWLTGEPTLKLAEGKAKSRAAAAGMKEP